MFTKRFVLFLLLIGLSYTKAYCQQDSFCNAVSTIIRDAPNKFHNIRGKQTESDVHAVTYESGIKVPGTIGSRFVVSMGIFYEGAFFQTKNKDELKAVYDKYKSLLNACLMPQGYVLSLADNFYPGLADYKKIVWMPEIKENTTTDSPPAHVTMEATYNKDVNNYTIVMYIFQH